MPDLEFYLSVLLFCFVSVITPGPNNIMIMSSGLNHGVRKSLPHYFGINIGFPLMLMVIGFGLGTVFLRYPVIHQIVKTLCIGYLLFLAWKIANTANVHSSERMRSPFTFIQAAAFQWINPKAWAMGIGVIATFTSGDNIQLQIFYIVAAFSSAALCCTGVWLGMGSVLQGVLRKPKQLQYFNISMAMLLVLSIVPMVLGEFGES